VCDSLACVFGSAFEQLHRPDRIPRSRTGGGRNGKPRKERRRVASVRRKFAAEIISFDQPLTRSSRSQSEKRGDRVVLKVKIESFSKCGGQQYQRDSRVVLKVAAHIIIILIKYLAKVPFLLRTVSRTGCSISLVTGGSMHRSPLSPLDGGACRAMEGLKNAKPDTAAHQIAPDSARQSIARRRVATQAVQSSFGSERISSKSPKSASPVRRMQKDQLQAEHTIPLIHNGHRASERLPLP
jgi:hypothetical protein